MPGLVANCFRVTRDLTVVELDRIVYRRETIVIWPLLMLLSSSWKIYGAVTGPYTFTGDSDETPTDCDYDCDECPFASTEEGASIDPEVSVKRIDARALSSVISN